MLTTGEAGGWPASPPDVVYRLRRNDRNEELRYSLRSLVNLAHGAVWFVGHLPAWVQGVRFIQAPRTPDRWWNALRTLRLACDQTPEFVLMDDDFFITEPLGEVPTHHGLTLEQHAEQARSREYRASLLATRAYLAAHGKPTLSYELHQPMLIDSARMAFVLDAIADQPTPLQARSLYGNWWGLPSTQTDDCKVRFRTDPRPAGPFLSTEDSIFAAFRPWLHSLFPAPSEYERKAA